MTFLERVEALRAGTMTVEQARELNVQAREADPEAHEADKRCGMVVDYNRRSSVEAVR